MNPVFWMIIIAVIIVIWVSLSFTFESIGKAVKDFFKNLFK